MRYWIITLSIHWKNVIFKLFRTKRIIVKTYFYTCSIKGVRSVSKRMYIETSMRFIINSRNCKLVRCV